MDSHLRDVKRQQRKLFDMMEGTSPKVDPIPHCNFTISSSKKLLADIEQNVEQLEKKVLKSSRSNFSIQNSFEVEEGEFFKGFTSDQRDAGHYFLNKIRALGDNDQLLMLLHGQPGSGKTFFIE